ncbi:hypothetical protein [Acanthamoeba polyphaga mimivirus]|nr:hypothetical protein [Acanthamoeba polyphaga mimivirus]
MNQPMNKIGNKINKSHSENKSAKNIIEEMLKPQKIVKDNKDVESSYKNRNKQHENILKKGDFSEFKLTNAPYKVIIKDKINDYVGKNIDHFKKPEQLIVHKADPKIDANTDRFNAELELKESDLEKINETLKLEFKPERYNEHKKIFEHKEVYIRNMAYEAKTFDDNKQDYIEFYRQKQKEAEEGKKLYDDIIRNIIDEGIISKDELPTENLQNEKDVDIDKIIIDMNLDYQ